jgi:hypothetical protein
MLCFSFWFVLFLLLIFSSFWRKKKKKVNSLSSIQKQTKKINFIPLFLSLVTRRISLLHVIVFTPIAFAIIRYTPAIEILINVIFSKNIYVSALAILAGTVAGVFTGNAMCRVLPDPSGHSTLYRRFDNDYVAPFAAFVTFSGPLAYLCVFIGELFFHFATASSTSEKMEDVSFLNIAVKTFLYEVFATTVLPLMFF